MLSGEVWIQVPSVYIGFSNYCGYRIVAMRPTGSEARVNRDSSSEQLLAAQLRLLYGNANLGVVVNIVAAAILGALQWGIVSKPTIVAWCLYITLVSIA